MPAINVVSESAPSSLKDVKYESSQMDRQRILVVDNDIGTASYVCNHLERSGYTTLAAYDEKTALQNIRSERPDLLVIELTLPDRDGLEVIRAIRDDACLRKLPIIILSARTSESDKQSGLDLGADDYMTKPFNARELVARVHAVLRRSYRQYGNKTPSTLTE
jgi:two-component system alkaline phosphatase synthesis response regulator PhoP